MSSGNVHDWISERIARGLREPEERDDDGPIDPPGGPPHDGGMDDVLRRIDGLESGVAEIRSILGRMMPVLERIDARLSALEAGAAIIEQRLERLELRVSVLPSGKDIGEISGKLSQLPNVWQLVIFGFAQVGMVAAIMKLLSR